MPRSNPLLATLSAGELSPRLHARLDFQKYPAGLETALNIIPLAEGGLIRRPAFRYVAEIKDSAAKGRVKKFLFSTTQAYMIEMANTAFRFYRHQAQIVVADTDAAITNGTFASDASGWDDVSTGGGSVAHDATNLDLDLDPGGTDSDDIAIAQQDVTTTDTNQEHVIKFRVKGAPGDKVEFQVGTTTGGSEILSAVEKPVGYHCVAFTPTASPFYIQFRNLGSNRNKIVSIDDVSLIDNAAVEIDTPYATADLFKVDGPQSADVLYLFHVSYPTYKLERRGHTTWSLVEVAWVDGPYLDENTTTTTLTPAADAGLAVNFTLSSINGVNDNTGWQSTDVGRLIRYKQGGNGTWGYAVIVSVTSTTVAVCDIRNDETFDQVWQVDETPADNAYVDETNDANSQTDADFVPFPTSEANNDYVAFGRTDTFGQITFDYANGTAGVGGTVTWEYWDGDSWESLTGVTDNTTGFTAAAADGLTVSWTVPAAWAARTLNNSPSLFYVRAKITGAYSTNPTLDQATAQVQASPAAVTEWRLGAWSGTTGYASTGIFYQQRLLAAATTDNPQTFWGSQTADFENFRPDDRTGTIEDDDAYNYTISSDEVNAIRWMRGSKSTLVIGTFGEEWVVGSEGAVVTPNDIVVDPVTSHGSAAVQPLRIGAVILFLQRAMRKIREMVFDFAVDGFQAFDMTRLAQHITKGGIIEIAHAEEPDGLVYGVRDDGVLLSMTYRREEDVVGWARHIIGGRFGTADPAVESVSTIPGADGSGQVQSSENRDEVWIIAKRTINGSQKRYIEVSEGEWEDGDDQEDAYYADSIITYDGTAATTITGLGHLNGETVKILADGAIVADQQVLGSQITLDTAASVVQIGLGYYHTIKPLKLITGTAVGTPLGKIKQIFGVTFSLLNSHTLAFGPDTSNLRKVDFREVEDTMDNAVPYFTGEYFAEWDDDWKTDPRMVIHDDSPTPFGLLALAPEVETIETK